MKTGRAQSEKPDTARALARGDRVRLYFGTHGAQWDEERVLDRYELLYEAGLIEESRRDGRPAALARKTLPALGTPMGFDHRRDSRPPPSRRLRAKLKYRPVVFELLPPEFTLTDLQRTVEAISGRHLHKQNFRRLVEAGALVEPTGEMSTQTGRTASGAVSIPPRSVAGTARTGIAGARPSLSLGPERGRLEFFA